MATRGLRPVLRAHTFAGFTFRNTASCTGEDLRETLFVLAGGGGKEPHLASQPVEEQLAGSAP